MNREHVPPTQQLIVNADDFGMSPGINAGIIAAHDRGIVTSASLMVRCPAATEAASMAAERPNLGIGLHLDIAEWVYHDGSWTAVYQVVPADDVDAIEVEVAKQLDWFHRLMRRAPTHIDSHQHVHMSEPIKSIVLGAARSLNIPVRNCADGIRHIGAFYGQCGKGEPYADGISVSALTQLIEALPPGVSELGCHPGFAEPTLATTYRAERAIEVETLCDRAVRTAVEEANVVLVSYDNAGPHAAPLATSG
jgi:predicted glycoside hydrolase/deacetylase ChbG (UPF0249 family)